MFGGECCQQGKLHFCTSVTWVGTVADPRSTANHLLQFDMDLQLVRELRDSIKDCSDRGLVVAGKWYTTALRRTDLTLKTHLH